MRSYNLFRRRGREALFCAVPESCAVPRFVGGRRWTFGGRIDGSVSPPPGFDDRAAATAVRFNGFYLFQCLDEAGTERAAPERVGHPVEHSLTASMPDRPAIRRAGDRS